MEFQNRSIVVDSPLGDLHVNVTAEALKVLWGEDVGPQDEDGLLAENSELFETIAFRKTELGGAEGLILTITGIDVEDEFDAGDAGA